MDELERYARQISVPGFGREGQRCLTEAHVSVAGADLAASVGVSYLAGAGIGRLDVDRALVDRCRAINRSIEVRERTSLEGALVIGDAEDPIGAGAAAARRILTDLLARKG